MSVNLAKCFSFTLKWRSMQVVVNLSNKAQITMQISLSKGIMTHDVPADHPPSSHFTSSFRRLKVLEQVVCTLQPLLIQ